MMVLGGRTNTVGENVQLEVYETESSEWKKFNSLQRFRHSIWAVESVIYIHRGFQNQTPNIPTNSIMKIDLDNLLKNTPVLLQKLEQALGGRSPTSTGGKSTGTSGNTSPNEGGSRATTPPIQSLAN